MKSKTCLVCGVFYNDTERGYYKMGELKSIYYCHGFKDLCCECSNVANSFIDYYGEKRDEDLHDLRAFLNSGKLPMIKFNALMYGGYFEE